MHIHCHMLQRLPPSVPLFCLSNPTVVFSHSWLLSYPYLYHFYISPIICLPFLLHRSSYIENMFLITLIFPKYYKIFEYIKMLKESYGVHPSMYLLDFIVNIMLHLLYHIFIHLSFLYSYIKFCNAFKSCRYRYSLC